MGSWFSAQKVVGYGVAAIAAAFVLYPVYFLLQAAFDVGDPQVRPPTAYGVDNFSGLLQYPQIMLNTLTVSFAATVMALLFGFVMAWILTRTNVPGRRLFEQLMAVPYYLTPLLGALAWSLLGQPESGFINGIWRALGGQGHLIDINTSYGIAWVMALFEGSVAFVMIAALMKSMDPSLEEASQVIGASRTRTIMRITLPLVIPGVLGAAIFVFAEMLGSFAVALVLGLPSRYYVITTAIYQMIQQYPPKIQVAAAMGVVAVRGDVRHALRVSARRDIRKLCDDHRESVPAAAARRRAATLCATRGVLALFISCRDLAAGHSAFRFAAENRRDLPNGRKLYPRQLSHGHDDECRAFGGQQQSAARVWHRHDRRPTDGASWLGLFTAHGCLAAA